MFPFEEIIEYMVVFQFTNVIQSASVEKAALVVLPPDTEFMHRNPTVPSASV